MIPCPVCNELSAYKIGAIQHTPPLRVAQVSLNIGFSDFEYNKCGACGFYFKTPEIPVAALLDCYERAEGDRWGEQIDPIERNFDVIASEINRLAYKGKILDIGCSNAAFLAYLGGEWEKFGVEPSKAAAAMAQRRGIKIVASTIDNDIRGDFNVLLAMDVVEHLPRPRDFFRRASDLLLPGGILVISTGDTDCWQWRLQREKYWYCATFPEHVSFYNRSSLKHLGASFGLRSISHQRISYKKRPFPTKVAQNVKGICFSALQRTCWACIPQLRNKYSKRGGTNWSSAKDHMVHVMMKE